MNNIVSNPKTEVSSGLMINDKDILNDLLSSLKCIVKDLTVVMTEASNVNLYNFYLEMFNGFITLQRNVYELIFQNGWYILEKEEQQKIIQKYNMLNEELTNLKN